MSNMKKIVENELDYWEEQIINGRYKNRAIPIAKSKIKVLRDVLKKHSRANDVDTTDKQALNLQNVSNNEVAVCDITKGTRCKNSFPNYSNGVCRFCGGQAN